MSSADLASAAAEPFRVFVGYASDEDMAYRGCRRRSSIPLGITPILQLQQELREARGLYGRERGPTESTEISSTRFLTPYLEGCRGWALFVDVDFLDVAALGRLASDADADPRHAVLCVHHDYTPTETEATKMDGAVQTACPRKNWSSMLLFDCGHSKNCAARTPEAVSTRSGPCVRLDYTPTEAAKMDRALQTVYPCEISSSMVLFNYGHPKKRAALTPEEAVSTRSGAYLHRFGFMWLDDDEVGEVPVVWNILMGHNRVDPADEARTAPRVIHSLSLSDCKFGDMNTTERWGNDDVNETCPLESRALIWLFIRSPSTQEQRTMWLMSNNNTRIFHGNTSGTMHMEAFQDMCLNLYSTNIIPSTNKKSGHCYLRDEPVSTRSPKEWPMDISLEDLLSYVHEAKADCGKAMKGCAAWFPMLLLMVDERKLIYNSILNVALSTKDATTHEALLFGCRTLPPLLNAAKIEDMNTTEMLRMVVDVNEIDTIESSPICMFPIGASSTQGPRTVWLLLKNIAREAFQNTFSHLNSACMTLWDCSSLEKNQAMMKKNQRISGGWLVKTEWGRSYKPSFHNQKGNNFKLSNVDYKLDGVSIDNNGLLFSSHFGIGSAPLLAVGDVTKSDSVLVSIFVSNVISSEPLVLTLNLDESSQHMMCLYAQKTNTKLDLQYFIYGRKMLEPDSTLLSYGIKANSTIHACTRLRGGAVTMTKYLKNNQKKFLKEVALPDGMVSLEMTKIGCLFLSTWLKCFTQAFANSKSWNGRFTKDNFKVVHGHVLVNTGAGFDAKLKLDSNFMRADMAMLVQYIRAIFYTDKSNLVSKFPPYMENLITFLESMGSPKLYDSDRLFIETHLCCVESASRGVLLLMVQRKLKSLRPEEQVQCENAMRSIDHYKYYADACNLSTVAVFQDVIREAKRRGQAYGTSKPSTFRLMRDHYTHAQTHRFDKSVEEWEEKFKNDDGIELMIPAHNKDFLPEVIYSMIIDNRLHIEAELLEAQVRCTCHICHPSHSESKAGAESSTAGKGKQLESPESSQPSTPSSRQESTIGTASALLSAWDKPLRLGATSSRQGSVRPPQYQQSHAAASSVGSQPSMSSSRQGSYLGSGRSPPYQQYQTAPSSRQVPNLGAGGPPLQQSHATASPGSRPPAPTQHESSSPEFQWQTAKRKGKGKRYD